MMNSHSFLHPQPFIKDTHVTKALIILVGRHECCLLAAYFGTNSTKTPNPRSRIEESFAFPFEQCAFQPY